MPSLWKEFFSGTTESQVEEHRQRRIQELHYRSIELLSNHGETDEKGTFLTLPAKKGGQEIYVEIWSSSSNVSDDSEVNIHIPLVKHEDREVDICLNPFGAASFDFREEGTINLFKSFVNFDKPSLGELMQYLNWIRPLHKDLIEEAPDQLPE